jgi:uncharacterized protein YndB with AHSA1/START domain
MIMSIKRETIYSKDLTAKQITVVREFSAPPEQVWRAWTESELLDKWWAPRPWKAVTKSMDFREGGRWLYYMEGPDGTRHWCLFDYHTIAVHKYFTGQDSFCDENGVPNDAAPSMKWHTAFSAAGDGTKVNVTIKFDSAEDLEKIVEMGFQEGFAAAHGNLDELLAE